MSVCKCRNVWCPHCIKRHLKRLLSVLESMNYQFVRHVVLTIDRKNFDNPADALESLTETSRRLVQYFQRQGHKIVNYVRAVEWHKDGYPHIHLLIELDRRGMIGGDVIRNFYNLGQVNESYFKTKAHWQMMTGYAAKTGYIGNSKDHQGVLPEWAKSLNTGSIRRYTYKIFRGVKQSDNQADKEDELHETVNQSKQKDKRQINHKTYQVVIDSCSENLRLTVYDPDTCQRYEGVVRNVKEKIGEFNKSLHKQTFYCSMDELFTWLDIVDPGKDLMPIERYMWKFNKSESAIIEDFNSGVYGRWLRAA